MKKFFLVALVVVLALAAVVVARAMLVRSKQVAAEPAQLLRVSPEQTAADLAQALRYATVSYLDPAKINRERFVAFHQFLERVFPRVHAALPRELVGEASLLYTWRGEDASLHPILLTAHMDVVPVEPGTESAWTHSPFSGDIAEGYVWGRGALDNKCGLIGILEAVEALLGEGFRPRRTVYLAFGADEEIGGLQGAAKIAALLRSRGVQPEFVLDEGGAVARGMIGGIARPVALVNTAEKGYLTLELSVAGESGHSSVPPAHTTIGILSAAIQDLENSPMASRLRGSTFERTLEYLAPEMSFGRRLLLANLWLFRPLVERVLSRTPATNALLRTTTAATVFEAGTKDNVLPTRARALVNFRLLPGETEAGVIEHVRAAIHDPRVQIRKFSEFRAEPPPESSADSPNFTLIARTIRQTYPGAVVAPSIVSGTADARHYAALTRDVYRFLPVALGPDDLHRFHGTNERISVAEFARGVQFYAQLLRNAAR